MDPEERQARERLREWIRHYHAQFTEGRPGATDSDFAAELDISASHLSNVLNGKRSPGLDVALKISKKYGRDLHRLFMERPGPGVPRDRGDPAPASPPAAKPGRRRRTGGGRA